MATALAIITAADQAGCSGTDERPTARPEASSSSGPPTTYGLIDDLVSAVSDAGLVCDRWAKPKRERLAADSRYCDDDDSIAAVSIYASQTQRDKAIQESVEFAEIWRDQDAPELVGSLLVGENWLVEGTLDEVQSLQPLLGGVVQDNTCAVANEDAAGC